jgi:hypothetical protein
MFEDANHRVEVRVMEVEPSMIGPGARSNSSARKTYKVSAQIKQTGPRRDESASQIWSVADLLQAGFTSDEISTAITSALDLMLVESKPASVRFHEETGLIMANGKWDQITLIANVIEQLRVAANQREQSQRQSASGEIASPTQRMVDARSAKTQTDEQLTQTLRDLEMAKARTEAVTREMLVGNDRLNDLQSQLQKREQMIHAYEVRMNELESEIARLKSEARKP